MNKYRSLYIFYLSSEQEINDKINNYILTFLLGGTLAFNELQIDRREQKLLEDLLYSPPLEFSVPYMLGLAEFLTKSMPIISSSMELFFNRFSKTPVVTESVDVLPIRHRNYHIPYTMSVTMNNGIDFMGVFNSYHTIICCFFILHYLNI